MTHAQEICGKMTAISTGLKHSNFYLTDFLVKMFGTHCTAWGFLYCPTPEQPPEIMAKYRTTLIFCADCNASVTYVCDANDVNYVNGQLTAQMTFLFAVRRLGGFCFNTILKTTASTVLTNTLRGKSGESTSRRWKGVYCKKLKRFNTPGTSALAGKA